MWTFVPYLLLTFSNICSMYNEIWLSVPFLKCWFTKVLETDKYCRRVHVLFLSFLFLLLLVLVLTSLYMLFCFRFCDVHVLWYIYCDSYCYKRINLYIQEWCYQINLSVPGIWYKDINFWSLFLLNCFICQIEYLKKYTRLCLFEKLFQLCRGPISTGIGLF